MPELWRRTFVNVNTEPDRTPQRSNLSAALAVKDHDCRLSAFAEGTTVAHICPEKQNHWFHSNAMQRYIGNTIHSGPAAINDSTNLVLLRQDLHTAFDAHRFAFTPKNDSNFKNTLLVAHVWDASHELTELYHNVAIRTLNGISKELLFARFALSVFPLVEGFLLAGIPRVLRVYEAIYQNTRLFTFEECFEMQTLPSHSRSHSPTNRGCSE